eukprot:scaffold76056_cov27-Tisochrysis_lutea.AAC.1
MAARFAGRSGAQGSRSGSLAAGGSLWPAVAPSRNESLGARHVGSAGQRQPCSISAVLRCPFKIQW